QDGVERFLGRIITDADFRTRAAQEPEKTSAMAGITLSREEMALLECIDFKLFAQVSDTISDSIRRI
ncbi:MAG: hypothetical protein HGB32_13530, partial [Geobacteraceae bacterium]|nr:hypothetical protein [Geobacteraceae bacterium]